jgi:8-oxo-dGTP diphosphatase
MNLFYSDKARHLVAVDCIIFGFDDEGLKLLLTRRKFPPARDEYSLVGEFLSEDESLDQAAYRILKMLTGLERVYLEQLAVYGDLQRDPGARVISVSYYALISTEDYQEELGEKYGASWVSLKQLPQLVFDHGQMVDKALRRLKRRAKTEPIGFELLPERFTIPQLQRLYEAIYMREFDKRNFRRKILAMGVLNRLNQKEKASSKKGAFFYQFDKQRYDHLVSEGFSFEV